MRYTKRWISAVLAAMLVAGTVAFAQGGPFAAQIEQFWALISAGGRAFTDLSIAASGYANFGSTLGSGGYGLRDNAGTVEVKNSGGAWTSITGLASALWTQVGSVLSPTSATQVALPNGTGAAPSIAFTSRPGLGFYKFDDSGFGLAAGGGIAYMYLGTMLSLAQGVSLQWTTNTSNPNTTVGTILTSPAANTLDLFNGTNPQTFNIYNTTDGTNKEYVSSYWAGNVFHAFESKAAGTGTVRSTWAHIDVIRDNTGAIIMNVGTFERWRFDANGNLVGNPSNGGYVQPPVKTVATLPTCNSSAEGARMGVTDATATTFLSTVAGGGVNHVPVYCNGTAWVIGG